MWRACQKFWQFRTILLIEVYRDIPVTYGRKSTYDPLNVNKGENSTFFSLNQGNTLFQVYELNPHQRLAKMEKNGHSRWFPATIDVLGDQWRQW